MKLECVNRTNRVWDENYFRLYSNSELVLLAGLRAVDAAENPLLHLHDLPLSPLIDRTPTVRTNVKTRLNGDGDYILKALKHRPSVPSALIGEGVELLLIPNHLTLNRNQLSLLEVLEERINGPRVDLLPDAVVVLTEDAIAVLGTLVKDRQHVEPGKV